MPTEMPPSRKHGIIDNAGLVVFFQLISDVGPVPAQLTPDKRVCIRTDGVAVRWDIKPGAVASHLVMVNISLGDPVPIEDLGSVF